jgi:hypothetical protein
MWKHSPISYVNDAGSPCFPAWFGCFVYFDVHQSPQIQIDVEAFLMTFDIPSFAYDICPQRPLKKVQDVKFREFCVAVEKGGFFKAVMESRDAITGKSYCSS